MLIKKPTDISANEITDEKLYQQRREFLKRSAALGVSAAALSTGLFSSANATSAAAPSVTDSNLQPLDFDPNQRYQPDEKLTPYEDVTGYNNFYEFGTSKYAPSRSAHQLQTRPWQIRIEGEVHKPQTIDIEDMLSQFDLQERIYRLRCVEGWSMVIPWIGFPLNQLLKRVEPTGNAKYVEFISLHDPKQMPGQRYSVLDWPYTEGLRLDEAMHDLTLVTVGLYGKVLPNQNGAPIRLVVPWKYGFKSAKSIVTIRLTDKMPVPSWVKANPKEYGFYSNVNPEVPHPRWSQRRERRIGEIFKRRTEMFNGYAEQVAHLYQGMNLKKHF